MPSRARITPCLWFDSEAEQAAKYYVRIFRNSKVKSIARYGEAGREQHGKPPGSVMIVEFELDGRPFTALNGGPIFKFNEAVSLQVRCKDQQKVDYYWSKLTAGGDPAAQVCGWLKDKYGLSWQIVPDIVPRLLGSPRSARSQRAFAEMMAQRKPDIAALQRAYDGKETRATRR
jgi:predicted 3-demethylubiquinone-9 3-methyltransferase (glyoxalase superfamily)